MIYVYCVTREDVIPETEGVDGTRRFAVASIDGVSATYTCVNPHEFSQEAIDSRAGDLEWLGAIGYRHQDVVADLMKRTAIVPLRAFTLFSSEEALRSYLHEHADTLKKVLERLDGKQEWTLQVEFEPSRWSASLASRVGSLRTLQSEIDSAAPGKAFLLRKKLEDEKKRSSKEAEQQVVAEIEQLVLEKLRSETLAETRERRDGAFPQINVLINRDEEAALQELHATLLDRYASEGVIVGLTGPWPPYTFAAMNDER
ncbi:MAG TPA: GvpL/GvpF family gas vesicle protein [Thermoanaerobaculia bacterium]|nr:GvpL/GvpF family gas vesicle protein [Thermoanaerobaculia bacterium]